MPAEKKSRIRKAPGAFLAIVLAFSVGCSLDYGPELAETLDDTPSLIFQGLEYRAVEKGEVVYLLKSQVAEEYSERREAKILSGEFTEFGSEGDVRTQGGAGVITVNQQTNDAVLKDNINFHSITEETRLSADELNWQNKTKMLTSPRERTVRVERKKNSTMEGTGFSLNMKTKTLTYTGSVQGTYINGEEE